MSDHDNINIGHTEEDDAQPQGRTEWEDALIKHGIMKSPPPSDPTDDETNFDYLEKKNGQDRMENKSLQELDDLEEDGMDEDIVSKYRAKRLAEIRAKKEAEKYGSYNQIGETDFVREVTEASKIAPVVCHLFVYSKPDCQQMNAALEQLSRRHKEVKFVKIISTEAIHGYPDSSTPTLLIYKNGALFHQIVGTMQFGGQKMNADTVEWILSELEILKTDQDENPFKKMGGAGRTNLNFNRKGNKKNDDDDDDDD